jgi:hypothetical protein
MASGCGPIGRSNSRYMRSSGTDTVNHRMGQFSGSLTFAAYSFPQCLRKSALLLVCLLKYWQSSFTFNRNVYLIVVDVDVKPSPFAIGDAVSETVIALAQCPMLRVTIGFAILILLAANGQFSQLSWWTFWYSGKGSNSSQPSNGDGYV